MVLAVYLAVVIFSGFAWPLGHGDLAVFPFYRAWFMFHREDGWYYHITLEALRDDGQREPVAMDRWFAWPASESTRRYDEIQRRPALLTALADYVCAQHNRDARPGARYIEITLTDNAWPQTRGTRVPFEDVPRARQRGTLYVRNHPCPRESFGHTP